MGTLYNGICYGTSSEAVDAYYTTPGAIQASDSYSGCAVITTVSKSGSTWQVVQPWKCNTTTGTNIYTLPSPSFPTCTQSQFSNFTDGMVLGWGVVAAMVAAWGIKFLADQLKR